MREAPDSMFPLNGTNGTELIDVAARDARRVHVVVALTALMGVIQVQLSLNVDEEVSQLSTLHFIRNKKHTKHYDGNCDKELKQEEVFIFI